MRSNFSFEKEAIIDLAMSGYNDDPVDKSQDTNYILRDNRELAGTLHCHAGDSRQSVEKCEKMRNF